MVDEIRTVPELRDFLDQPYTTSAAFHAVLFPAAVIALAVWAIARINTRLEATFLGRCFLQAAGVGCST